MSDPIIRVENLGKEYLIRHEAGRKRYKSLRDTLANGVVAAARDLHIGAPIVVRMEGTNVELGRQILRLRCIGMGKNSGTEDNSLKNRYSEQGRIRTHHSNPFIRRYACGTFICL